MNHVDRSSYCIVIRLNHNHIIPIPLLLVFISSLWGVTQLVPFLICAGSQSMYLKEDESIVSKRVADHLVLGVRVGEMLSV